jgi:hypothetical protein
MPGRRLSRELSVPVFSELEELVAQGGIRQGQNLHGQNGGVLGAGFADGDGGHRDAGGHLDRAEQGIQAGQAAVAGQGDADDGQRGPGGHRARQVGGHAGGGDDHPDAAGLGGLGELGRCLRRAVRGKDSHQGLDPELAELVHAALHDAQVAIRPHDDRYWRCFFRCHCLAIYYLVFKINYLGLWLHPGTDEARMAL